MIRFQQTLGLIEKGRPVDWVGIAHECGYYDQAHFINDFRRFSGFTPGEYYQIAGNDPNYVPIR